MKPIDAAVPATDDYMTLLPSFKVWCGEWVGNRARAAGAPWRATEWASPTRLQQHGTQLPSAPCPA
jgi:hypothetical protein